jgi:hypothetical protein
MMERGVKHLMQAPGVLASIRLGKKTKREGKTREKTRDEASVFSTEL